MTEPQQMSIGPLKKDFVSGRPKGECPECGSDCAPECGRHPAGCIWGGFTEVTSYWLVAEGCDRFHGDRIIPLAAQLEPPEIHMSTVDNGTWDLDEKKREVMAFLFDGGPRVCRIPYGVHTLRCECPHDHYEKCPATHFERMLDRHFFGGPPPSFGLGTLDYWFDRDNP